MNTTTISLGAADRLAQLYSYPNFPGDTRSLADTIAHWFGMTLDRDGLTALGASSSVRVDGSGGYFLDLNGPPSLNASFALYASRLPQFLSNGWDALTEVVPMLKATGKWDPCPDGPTPPYHPWRFFLPHGMAMLNQKALLFFHYPPIRLLDVNQDYLDDPVPVRLEELLCANGVSSGNANTLAAGDIMLFNTVMDATPIGAEDDQGSKKPTDPNAAACDASCFDPAYGLIPIQYFHDYQKAMVSLLLNPSQTPGYTVPIVVYGSHPVQTFNAIYGTSLKNYAPTVVSDIIPGKKTPVLASSHPYVFYGKAQGFDSIGSGIMPPGNVAAATQQMQSDLAVSGWLAAMYADPTQDTVAVWKSQSAKWTSSAQAPTVKALVNHQGSLFYKDPTTLAFTFNTPLVWPSSPKPGVASPTPMPSASAKAKAKPSAVAMKRALASSSQGLQVIGDNGQPVDWWFAYKISKQSKSSKGTTPKGSEYLYFDSVMAAANAKPVMSNNLLDQSGVLHDTLGQLFTDAAKANKDLGYFCYNDEDRLDAKGGGTGPSTKEWGHCKGALAFDLASDTAFWLIHSIPLLPMNAQWAYPPTGYKEAQTLLCIQLPNAAASKPIAQLIFNAHGPNVNVASDMLTTAHDKSNNFSNPPVTNVPKTLGMDDPRVKLMQDTNGSMGAHPAPWQGQLKFTSKGGMNFLAIAKNRAWGNPVFDTGVKTGTKDFYNELVSVALNEDIDVETWQDDIKAVPPHQESGETHVVENMLGVDLSPLGIEWSWTDAFDHAKLCISDRDNPPGSDRYVCVGDINFTDSMEARGGGTVAFICNPLWQALSDALTAGEGNKSSAAKAAKSKPVSGKPAATKAKSTAAKPSPASSKPSSKRPKPAKKSSSKKPAKSKKAAKPRPKMKKAAKAGRPAKRPLRTTSARKRAAPKELARHRTASRPKAGGKPARRTPAAKKKTTRKALARKRKR